MGSLNLLDFCFNNDAVPDFHFSIGNNFPSHLKNQHTKDILDWLFFVLTISLSSWSVIFSLSPLHCSDRFQREIEEAVRDFRLGHSRVLVATSITARELIFPEVKHVIIYDLPQHIEAYVHCIGRMGHFGNKGMATAFFQRDRDGALAGGLVKVLADVRKEGGRGGECESEREKEGGREMK